MQKRNKENTYFWKFSKTDFHASKNCDTYTLLAKSGNEEPIPVLEFHSALGYDDDGNKEGYYITYASVFEGETNTFFPTIEKAKEELFKITLEQLEEAKEECRNSLIFYEKISACLYD